MAKKTKKKTLINKLDRVFSLFIRKRDALKTTGTEEWCICFTCGKRIETKKIHAGHFISRRYKSVRWDERNVHGQCAGCNSFKGGAPHEYFVNMERIYGRELVDELMTLKNQVAKFSVGDLQEMYDRYK